MVLFHPVTSEVRDPCRQARTLVDALLASNQNYIVIYPNNDHGTEIILEEYERLRGNPRFKLYPSIRFEYFLRILKEARFMIGNSSAGAREAPHFGLPAINLGTRQNNRVSHDSVINAAIEADAHRRRPYAAANKASSARRPPCSAPATAPRCSTPSCRTKHSGGSRPRNSLWTGRRREGYRAP